HTTRRMIFFYAVALVNVLSTLLPVWPGRFHTLRADFPVSVILLAQHITLFIGITMLLLAFPAARGHRRAAKLLMLCGVVAVFANLLKGLDAEEAVLNIALLAVLWSSRNQLQSLPVRYTVVDVARLAVFMLLILLAYNVVGEAMLDGLRLMMKRGRVMFPWAAHFEHTLTAKLPLQLHFFGQTQVALPLFLLAVFLIFSWNSLIRQRADGASGDVYARFGRASHNSLAYVARRGDVDTFVDAGGRGAITYKLVGRVALQVGAILAQPEDREAVYRGFVAFCDKERLVPAAVALSHEERPIARACGMRTLNVGTEAIVTLADFSVDRLIKKMRWAQRSLSKRGFHCEILSAAEIVTSLRLALDHIDAEWRDSRGGESHGFSMTLGRFPTHADPECLIAIMRDEHEQPVAYLTLLPGGEGLYSLDLTRRTHAAPNAAMEFLMMEALTQLKQRGAAQVSLNFSTMSSLASSKSGNAALKLVGRVFQLGTLEAFNAKFRPDWVPRYTAFPSLFSFPDVAYAILKVEGVDKMVVNAAKRSVRRRLHPAAGQGVDARMNPESVVSL
ncbi:MAG TPA: phosphatidylglycerol lysyltransferase domain-containing protein, partial [Ktedonobacterales bacterium]|nr:phosphatidylglycerol lysyltransferase domain-containing protein [Ktedonobacterales bacterium]